MSATDAVDRHERTKNFLTEAKLERFLQAAKSGRHGIRDHLMMLLMYRHGLRETELCRLTVSALDLETARIWIERLKGSLSTHHPIDELRAMGRYTRWRTRGRTNTIARRLRFTAACPSSKRQSKRRVQLKLST